MVPEDFATLELLQPADNAVSDAYIIIAQSTINGAQEQFDI